MRRASSLRRRVRDIEQAHGAGAITLEFADGSKRGFSLRRNDCLQVLLGAFEIARAANNPDVQPHASPAIELARLVGKAERVIPPQALWETVAAIVKQAEQEELACTRDAPEVGSD